MAIFIVNTVPYVFNNSFITYEEESRTGTFTENTGLLDSQRFVPTVRANTFLYRYTIAIPVNTEIEARLILPVFKKALDVSFQLYTLSFSQQSPTNFMTAIGITTYCPYGQLVGYSGSISGLESNLYTFNLQIQSRPIPGTGVGYLGQLQL